MSDDTPIFQLVKADRLARNSAAHVIALNDDLVITVQKAKPGFPAGREMRIKTIHADYIDSPSTDFHSQQRALGVGGFLLRNGPLFLAGFFDAGTNTAIMKFDRNAQAGLCRICAGDEAFACCHQGKSPSQNGMVGKRVQKLCGSVKRAQLHGDMTGQAAP